MKFISHKEAAKMLDISHSHLMNLLRNNNVKRFNDTPRSPYLITEQTIEKFKNRNKERQAVSRCEPCKHRKKRCKSCGELICYNDFHNNPQTFDSKVSSCKNCQNKNRASNRNAANAANAANNDNAK